MLARFLPMATLAALLTCTTHAATLAYDDAADAAYNDGFQNGDNGGFGFQPWMFNNSGPTSGEFVWTSGSNGGGATNPNIDTSGRSWGHYASGGSVAIAIRPFTLPGLTTVSYEMDNGWIDAGSFGGEDQQSMSLVYGGSESFMVTFRGGHNNYEFAYQLLNQSVVYVDSGIGFTDTGVDVLFKRVGTNQLVCELTRLSDNANVSHTFNTFFNNDLIGFATKNVNGGGGSSNDLYVNKLKVEGVPEPATMCVLGFGALVLMRRRR